MTDKPALDIPGLSKEQTTALRRGGVVAVDPAVFRGRTQGIENARQRDPVEKRTT